MAHFIINTAAPADYSAIDALQKRAFGDAAWAAGDVAQTARAPHVHTLSLQDTTSGVLVAFALWRLIIDEAEILSIGVDPASRREGFGKALLVRLTQDAASAGAARIFLEVGKSNIAAISMYSESGFRIFDQRKNYYRNGDAALLMALPLAEAP